MHPFKPNAKFYFLVILVSASSSFVVGVLSDIVGRDKVKIQEPFSKNQSRILLFSSERGAGNAGFYLTSSDGKPRAILSIDAKGSCSFHLLDNEQGNGGITITAGSDGLTGLGMTDHNNSGRVGFTLHPDNSTKLVMRDKDGNDRIRLYLDQEGNPSIKLFNKDKQSIFSIP